LFIPKSNAGNVLASSNWLQLAQFIDKKGFECMTSFNNPTNTRRGENKRDVKNVFVFSRISAWDWETVFFIFLKKMSKGVDQNYGVWQEHTSVG
jgi:hypothetical protein